MGTVACVAWRFWLGKLSNKGGRGQRNREEIGARATWKTACTDGGLFWVGPYASVFSRGLAATPLVCPARQNRHATQATRTWAIWSWVNLETSKTNVNYSVDFVGHRELAIFFKFFAIGREYTPLTIKIVSLDIRGTYHFHLGWVRGWCSGQFFQVTGMIEVCFFLGLKFSVLRFSGTNFF